MKLLHHRPLVTVEKTVTEPKNEPKKPSLDELYPDEYPDMIEPRELVLNARNKVVFTVKRDDQEYGLPHLTIRHYDTTKKRTGPTKKAIKIPVELLYDFAEILSDVMSEVEGIE